MLVSGVWPVGAGVAAKEISEDCAWRGRVGGLRDAFEAALNETFVKSVTDAKRLPGHSHLRYPGVDAETALIRLDREGIAASSGAACSSGSLEPSHVLAACGYSETEAKEGLRFTFGRENCMEEAIRAAEIVNHVCDEIWHRRNG